MHDDHTNIYYFEILLAIIWNYFIGYIMLSSTYPNHLFDPSVHPPRDTTSSTPVSHQMQMAGGWFWPAWTGWGVSVYLAVLHFATSHGSTSLEYLCRPSPLPPLKYIIQEHTEVINHSNCQPYTSLLITLIGIYTITVEIPIAASWHTGINAASWQF